MNCLEPRLQPIPGTFWTRTTCPKLAPLRYCQRQTLIDKPKRYFKQRFLGDVCIVLRIIGPNRPQKHKDPTDHGLWYPLCKVLMFMWSFGPLQRGRNPPCSKCPSCHIEVRQRPGLEFGWGPQGQSWLRLLYCSPQMLSLRQCGSVLNNHDGRSSWPHL